MAGKGTYGAYKNTKAFNIDWGKTAKTGVDREDALRKQGLEEVKAERERIKDLDYEALEQEMTGIDSLDQGTAIGVNEAAAMLHDDYKRAVKDSTYGDSSEYHIRRKNLQNYAKNINTMSAKFSEISEAVIKLKSTGQLSAWDNELMQSINGAFNTEAVKFGVNDDGTVKASIALTDESLITDENPKGFVKDADGNIKMRETTLAELFKGRGAFAITPKVDVVAEATNLGQKLGKDIRSKIKGNTTTVSQTWDTKKESAKGIVKTMLGSAKAPSSLAKNLWAQTMGRDSRNLTDEDMAEMEEYFLDKVGAFYDQEVKKSQRNATATTGTSKLTASQKDNQRTPSYLTDSSGAVVEETIKIEDKNVKAKGISLGTDLLLTDSETTKERISDVYIDASGNFYGNIQKEIKQADKNFYKDDGTTLDVAKTALATGISGWIPQETVMRKLTNAEANKIAKHGFLVDDANQPFNNAGALVTFLNKGKKSTSAPAKSGFDVNGYKKKKSN